jgi:predicted HNH restriction endonuclease
MKYIIITENDTSNWDDETGVKYHFPPTYRKLLTEGTKVIYYKGRLIDKTFQDLRLSNKPHYFGIGTIGKIKAELNSKNYFAEINNFGLFTKAVPFKTEEGYLEVIPASLKDNYWRNGVRQISKAVYDKIVNNTDLSSSQEKFNDHEQNDLITILIEGGKKKVYTTVYERNRKLRDLAVRHHGYSCMACGFNFKEHYGEWGEGYIHVHHLKPVSTNAKEVMVDPVKDLVVVCANCHSMIHRRKSTILTIKDIQTIITKHYEV